jgi:hypothetical protein
LWLQFTYGLWEQSWMVISHNYWILTIFSRWIVINHLKMSHGSGNETYLWTITTFKTRQYIIELKWAVASSSQSATTYQRVTSHENQTHMSSCISVNYES